MCLQEGYVESQHDNEHEESSDADESADSDGDKRNKQNIYPNEKDLESVDWDIFCFTGELMKKKDSIMALCTAYGKMLKWQTV